MASLDRTFQGVRLLIIQSLSHSRVHYQLLSSALPPATASCSIVFLYSEHLSLTTEAPRLYIPQYPVSPIQIMESIENHIVTGNGPPWHTEPDAIPLPRLRSMVGVQADHNFIETKDLPQSSLDNYSDLGPTPFSHSYLYSVAWGHKVIRFFCKSTI